MAKKRQLMADVVLEGGGVKGIALVGALSVLSEKGYAFNRVAGTSAGAVVGALVASGMPMSTLVGVMRDVDYARFRDNGPEDWFVVGKAFSLMRDWGVYEGRYLVKWLGEALRTQGVRTFDNLPLPYDAGSLPLGRRHRLVVLASDVTNGQLRHLPWDYPQLGRQPGSQRVVDAVRASMSIPFFFEPVRLSRPSRDDVVLVDGGMLSNFPVAVFDRPAGDPRWPTFGIKLSARTSPQQDRFRVKSVVDLGRAMVGTLTSFTDQRYVADESVQARTIFVDTSHVSATDFGLRRKDVDDLYENGREAATEFLRNWDFDEYIATHRREQAA